MSDCGDDLRGTGGSCGAIWTRLEVYIYNITTVPKKRNTFRREVNHSSSRARGVFTTEIGVRALHARHLGRCRQRETTDGCRINSCRRKRTRRFREPRAAREFFRASSFEPFPTSVALSLSGLALYGRNVSSSASLTFWQLPPGHRRIPRCTSPERTPPPPSCVCCFLPPPHRVLQRTWVLC